MKKFLYLVVFVIASGVLVQAQTMDTIFWNQRRADFYYGSSWIDSNVIAHLGVELYHDDWRYELEEACDYSLQGDQFVGRPYVTNTPLKIVGVAAPVTIVDELPIIIDTSRVPEYFQVYQHADDSIIFLDEVRWDTATPQYLIEWKVWWNSSTGWMSTTNLPLYEAYFEKPVYVHDTFYVGGTRHNNLMWGMQDEGSANMWANEHPMTSYHSTKRVSELGISPEPNYFIYKYYWWTIYKYPPANYIFDLPIFDTTQILICEGKDRWFPFFAIFDTNFVPGVGTYDDSCLAPTGLHTEGSTATSVTLAWNAGGETLWQLSVYEDGTNPNDGLLLQTPINYAFIDNLELGHWYRAQVRTLCDTDVFGDWSDTVLFLYGTLDDTITCQKPTNLAVHSTDVGMVVLTWAENTEVTSWLVEVGSADTPVGEGAVTTAPVPFTMRNGLDTAMWHWARVRSKCGTDWYSLWTDTVMFYIPGDGNGGNPDNPNDTTQAINLVEQYTYLMPNPARDEVTVASSFRVKAVELYGSDGKLLQRKEVNAVGTTLSLEGLPAGIYFVRVRTSAGVTTKRLVVE